MSLARGSRIAAAVLVFLALAMALLFEVEYREALARNEARVSATTGGPPVTSTNDAFRTLVDLNRTLASTCAFLGAVYTGGFVLAVWYRRKAWSPESHLPWRPRVAVRLGFLRARMTPRAVLYGTSALVCALIVLAPALILFIGLYSRVPRFAQSVPLLDWASGDVGWRQSIVAFTFAIASLRLWTRAKRHATLGLACATTLDTRPPLLLLRSFADDTTPLERTSDQYSWQRQVVSPELWTLEESLEHFLRRHGPIVAVGRPGESRPPAGAAREYVDCDRWKTRIEQLVEEARLVVVVLGETEGLRFEYETLRRLGALHKVILIVPDRPAEALAARWERFREVLAPDCSSLPVDLSRAMAAYFQHGIMTLVVCHRRDDEDCYSLALNRALAATLVHAAAR
jgi:hypothetical protein